MVVDEIVSSSCPVRPFSGPHGTRRYIRSRGFRFLFLTSLIRQPGFPFPLVIERRELLPWVFWERWVGQKELDRYGVQNVLHRTPRDFRPRT